MSQELFPSNREINQHFDLLAKRLSLVPELEPAFALVEVQPTYGAEVYTDYLDLTDRMATLDEGELLKIQHSQTVIKGEVGSASKVGANDLLDALGGQKNVLPLLAAQSLDRESPYYSVAVDTLVSRLQGGHNLKLSGKVPSDHDAASQQVIWGHTVITGQKALLHFTVMHYLERYMAEALSREGIGLARQKDFFINAMTDVVILNGLAKPDNAVYKLWVCPKDQGGLGWITQDRLDSYNTEA